MITVQDAALLYKVSVKTVQRWVREDHLQNKNSLYCVDDLQKSYDKRRASKPRLRWTI